MSRAARRFLGHHAAVASVLLLGLIVAAALAAPLVASVLGHDPFTPDLFNRYAPPSAAHPLGTDELGRDLLLRLLYGGRVSLTVGIVAALVSAILGTAIGLAAAWSGGLVDAVLMRLADGLLALPSLPLLIVLAAVDPSRLSLPRGAMWFDLARIVLIIALFGWVKVARLARASALSILRRDYARAAVALGASGGRVLWRHVAPNLAAHVTVASTQTVGAVILLESVLSFLGLGIQPPTPSWGNMLAGAQELVFAAPMAAIWPGLMIFATVVATNFIGDGLADALDPRAEPRHA
ncbi:ABC transporter permease [Elioraea tepida]|uniref:ABC transporter permease n=1 Tax=Elioraea tepida TaxID=2843330 RepID=A0A975U2Z9_9PROT|nr:ABC transporter permease [Elioraea tepida]QXM25320.1 ABC transporter permease [Elioraea tepida]